MTSQSSTDEPTDASPKRAWKGIVLLIVAGLVAAGLGALVMSQFRGGVHRGIESPSSSPSSSPATSASQAPAGSTPSRSSPTLGKSSRTTEAPSESEKTFSQVLPGRILLGLGALIVVVAPAVIVASGLRSRTKPATQALETDVLDPR